MNGSTTDRLDDVIVARYLPLVRSVLFAFAEGLVVEGHLDPRKHDDDELIERLKEELEKTHGDKTSEATADVACSIDFTQTLLRQARRYAKEGKHENCALYYTLWLEHRINKLIVSLGRRRAIV